MLLSLFTNGLEKLDFETMLDVASGIGIEGVEVATGNFSPTVHLKADELLANGDARKAYKESIARRGMKLCALNCSGNQLAPGEYGRSHAECVEKTMRLAEKMEIKTVVMMSGLPGSCPEDRYPNWVTNFFPNMQEVLDYQWNEVLFPYWEKLVVLAKNCGVEHIALELHPNQLVYNYPALQRLRKEIDPMIGLNLDPAHQFWMGADPLLIAKRAMQEKCLYWVHAKDCLINPEAAAYATVLDTRIGDFTPAERAWCHVPVGTGHTEQWWQAFIYTLSLGGYNGPLSIEVEHRLTPDNRTDIKKSADVLIRAMR